MNISFIIPVYNGETTIFACLSSIVSEMDTDDDIIVVDNGSTDNTLNIVKKFSNVHIVGKPGLSIGGLRNCGARYSAGEVLAFIDSDCVICEKWRDSVVDTLGCNDISVSGSKYLIPPGARWIEKAWFSQKNRKPARVNYINSGNLVIKRQAFDEIDGFDEGLVTGEDAEFCKRLILKGYVVFENPEIRAIHLGNPKDLAGFYNKQRWHGLGMFGTFKLTWYDKPIIMTLFFIASYFAAVLMLFNADDEMCWLRFIYAVLICMAVPVMASTYRVVQYGNMRHFAQLCILYTVYFAARANALLLIICKQLGFKNKRV